MTSELVTNTDVDALLSKASADGENAEPNVLERVVASNVGKGEDFVVTKPDFNRQYSHIYFQRLVRLRPVVAETAGARFPDVPVLQSLRDLSSEPVVIVGTLYKEMELKHTILKQYADEIWLPAPPPKESYVSDTDSVVLEDESGRIPLIGDDFDVSKLTTGLVVGVLGTQIDAGFRVESLILPGLAPQAPLPASNDKYMLLVSGLRIGSEGSDPLARQLLVDFVAGHLGGSADHSLQSKIAKVVLAGNSIELTTDSKETGVMRSKETFVSAPLEELDLLLTELSASVDVDLMPSESDPASFNLPQQAINRGIFPTASRFSTYSPATNPHAFSIDGVEILGEGGRMVADIMKYTVTEGPTEVLEHMLNWRHIAPTCPDTLACYPFYEKDPFIIKETPHIFFTANTAEYSTSQIDTENGQKATLIAVPDFSKTATAVLVNLSDLSCSPLTFNVEL